MPDDDPPDDQELAGEEDFRAAFGEDPSAMLDTGTWANGLDLAGVTTRMRREVATAVGRDEQRRAVIRGQLLPELAKRRLGGSIEGGVYRARSEELETLQGLLFSGRVEAVSGSSVSHESLPIGITQVGVAVVSYGGTSGTFVQRLYRREVSSRSMDEVEEANAIIYMRQNRAAVGRRNSLARLARHGLKVYAERSIIVGQAEAEWRIGQGNPCARELLSGAGYTGLLDESLRVLRRLIQEHKKFVFVPSALEDRGLLTLGYALDAGEYALVNTLEGYGRDILEGGEYRGAVGDKVLAFVNECCPQVIMGLIRASDRSPPRVFYAHREHVHVAARVALADSVLRAERGFPMLLDVANVTCQSAFGEEGFMGMVHDAYTRAGASFRYLF